MSEAIIGSLMVAVLGMIANIVVAMVSANKTQALLNYRMDAMEKKLDKAEQDIEPIKQKVTIIDRDLKTAFNRIDDLRGDVKEIKKEK